jgi:exopolysaccharide biosynthesis polyprenyl glycosylphosphotransferase
MLDGELQRQRALFAASDTAALTAAVSLAWVARTPFGDSCPLKPGQWADAGAGLIALIAIWVMVARAAGLYQPRNGFINELIAIVKTACITWLVAVVLSFFAHLAPSRLSVLAACMLSVVFVAVGRALARRIMKYFYAHPAVTIPMVIVGANPTGCYVRDRIAEELTQYEFLGFIDDDPQAAAQGVLGGVECIGALAVEHPNLEAAIVLPDAPAERVQQIVALCERHHICWRLMPWAVCLPVGALKVEMVGMVPLIGPRKSNIEGLNYIIKRGFDIIAAALLALVCAPIMAIAALAVRLFDGPPVLFRQNRVGIHGKPFELLKFRTMRTNCAEQVHREYVKSWIEQDGAASGQNGAAVYKLRADPRITRVGAWLRKFSIDELPQLINVLRGEMSLIGPRPALPYELELYQDWHRHRLDAPPGITGLWQVSGRNRLSFDEMVQLDIEYIEDWSLYHDLGILLRTLPAMFGGSGL